ncbi:MAG TPA: hypothetical protein VFT99_25805, partial [Roseiflexaceae bacterium]|nr:hypothetical protein [Roseiflexaceae bacterium]
GSSMGINIDRIGQGYQLSATSGTLSGKSAPFNITASQLRFSSEPGNTKAGATFGAEVVATDSYGTIDTTFTGQVTLGLTGGPGGVSLKPIASPMAAAVNGKANFGNALLIDRVGQAYKLTASSGSLNAFSSAFNITANQLRFTTSPGNTQAGTQFNVVVEATDNFGNVDTTFASPVTLWLSGGALLATLEPSGALTATAANGEASFSGLHIDRIGQGYVLLASGGGLNGKSAPFNITASQFRFWPAPGNTRADATFMVTVLATDGYGSIDTTFTSSVTLGLVGGTDGAILSSPGSLTIAAVNGQAPFSGLSINRVGQNYRLQATGGGLAGQSAAFNVTASKLTFQSSPTTRRANDDLGAIVVQATDSFGTVDTTYTGLVSLGLTGGNASASLENGIVVVAASNGVAKFSSALRISYVGQNYQLTAASGPLSGLSAGFNITADRLMGPGVVISAANKQVGTLVIYAADGHGTIDTFNSYTVTLTILSVFPSGPGKFVPDQERTQTTVNGMADFGNLKINQDATYTVEASSPGLLSTNLTWFVVP